MGLFTEITHPVTGRKLQIKTGVDGWTDWQKKVGDPIPKDWTMLGGRPEMFEGAHIGIYADFATVEFGQAWVIVKDGRIHAIEDCLVPGSDAYVDGMSEDYARVCDLHGVPKNDPSYAPAGKPDPPA